MPARGDYVVIATDLNRRGVFAGILAVHDEAARTIILQEARNCLYWSAATHGFLGLASIGPQAGSRVSSAVPELSLDGVTAILVATPEARTAWESEPWTDPA